jgi:predicted NBD/HSP70 family sugar kinase
MGSAVKPVNGVCCTCGFSGEVDTTCSVRKDGTHCVHWWEGSDGDVQDTSDEKSREDP